MEGQHVYVNAEPRTTSTFARFIHCRLCFIYARKFYVRSHGKIARQWKSTLDLCTKKAWVHGRERTQLEDAILDLLN